MYSTSDISLHWETNNRLCLSPDPQHFSPFLPNFRPTFLGLPVGFCVCGLLSPLALLWRLCGQQSNSMADVPLADLVSESGHYNGTFPRTIALPWPCASLFLITLTKDMAAQAEINLHLKFHPYVTESF